MNRVALQMQGLRRAFHDPREHAAIRSGPSKQIAISCLGADLGRCTVP
jgi:hypothetical protein